MNVKFWATARLEDGICKVTIHGKADYHNAGQPNERSAFRRIELDGEKTKGVAVEIQKLLDSYVGKEGKGPMVMEIQAAGYEAYKYERDHGEIKLS